jgi:cell division septation protein DedD
MIKNAKIRRKNMRNTAIKLMVLSLILLVSMSSTVLGYGSYATNPPDANGTPVNGGTIDVTGTPTIANAANVAVTETGIQETIVATPEVVVTTESTPEETSAPIEPVKTPPKSPGFGSVLSVVGLLSAMYIAKRR